MRLDRAAAATAAVLLAIGCRAPTQVVPLHLDGGTRVFVDGRELPPTAVSVELRSDRPHVVHLRQDGHRAQQVVLETRPGPEGPRLEPGEIRVRLEPVVPTERSVEVEADD